MMMAFDAEASSTSLSLMAPTPLRSTRMRTFSLESFCIMSAEHFGGAADVRLENDVELLDLAFLQLLVQLFERDAAALRPWRLSRAFASR